jgi:dTDP-4-amino-4,6-dideoxy-D-galactose acyltransferase
MKMSHTSKLTAEKPPMLLDWDSEWWGIRVGYGERVEGLGQWARENTIGLTCLLVDDPSEAQQAEALGFRFMDVRVTLERPTGACGASSRLAKVEDLVVLRQIARTSHRITRFYADPSLPDEKCDELYEEWIMRSFAGWADIVLVEDRDGGPVGYVTVHLKGETSSIGLIAVAEEHRGKGVGQALVSSAVDWARSQKAASMSVVTQGRNIEAQRTFQRAGFLTTKTQLWFHRRQSNWGPDHPAYDEQGQ